MGFSVNKDKLSPVIKRFGSNVSESGIGQEGGSTESREHPS